MRIYLVVEDYRVYDDCDPNECANGRKILGAYVNEAKADRFIGDLVENERNEYEVEEEPECTWLTRTLESGQCYFRRISIEETELKDFDTKTIAADWALSMDEVHMAKDRNMESELFNFCKREISQKIAKGLNDEGIIEYYRNTTPESVIIRGVMKVIDDKGE